jgi:cytochrome c oxidase subunit 4
MTEYTAQLAAEETHEKKKPNYLLIFGVLAIITLIEVTVAANTPLVLVVLSLAKIVLVAMYYMHLKFETGWFTAIFLIPIPFVLMITVALIVALAPGPDNAAAAAGVCSFW